ncbi:MAG TPA: DUF6318 family protein [Micromonosporaceae bacterium]|nr:DUF6318 family protein [Micromonosporaceae bacterium]
MTHALAQHYELETVIGRGPTGEVWRAVDRGTRDVVAIKVLDSKFGEDPATVERFVRERQVLMAFFHPAFVRVRDLVADGGVLALVMEHISGADLRRHLSHAQLPVSTAVTIGLRIAEALAAAHDAGLVHCDLKPSNVLLDTAAGVPRVTDCRVARLAYGFQGPAAWYTSPEYVAPEVIAGGPPVPATDVYAFGLTLYEMLTGVPPYRGSDPQAVLAGHASGQPAVPMTVPPHLRRLIEECLDPNPVGRPSAREVTQGLQYPATTAAPTAAAPAPSLAPTAGSQAPPPPPYAFPSPTTPARPPAARPGGSRRRLAIAASAAAVALTLVVAGILVTDRREPPQAGTPATGASSAALEPIAAPSAPPSLAASATPESLEGATAFVYHWFAALNYAVSTGDVTAFQAASSPQCRACADAGTVIRDGYRDRASLRGGTYTVRTVSADDFWSLEAPTLRIVFDRSPRSAIGPDGSLVEVVPGGSFLTCQVVLERADGAWRVREVLSPEPIV